MAKEKEERYYVAAVPTQTETVIVDREHQDEDGNPIKYDIHASLVKILNELNEIKKGMLG